MNNKAKLGISIILGTGVGILIGFALHQIGAWVGIGIAIGTAVGVVITRKKNK